MRTSLAVRGGLGLALVSALALSACQPPPGGSGPAQPGAGGGEVGSVQFELKLGGGYELTSVSYNISGNGFQRAGAVDLSASTTFSTLVSGIPVGHGYTLALTANQGPPKPLRCQGNATFDIASASTTNLPVHLACRPPAPNINPPSVPVPPAAGLGLAVILAAIGAVRLRRGAAR
jgi:hypothetical protein